MTNAEQDVRAELEQVRAERDALWSQQTTLIPVAEVHAFLDDLGVPRKPSRGRALFLKERFALLKQRVEGQEGDG